MGVHGLWSLLEPVGKPVPLETLENKVLAVDISIWLHQATKGFRDAQGNSLHNAHLLGLCHRLCKLLFYRIKPVFVFDGGVPVLKRQTMASRQKVRTDAIKKSDKVAEKMMANYIQSELINQELGNKPRKPQSLPVKKKQEKDMFELPPIPEDSARAFSESSDSDEDFEDVDIVSTQLKGHTIHSVDFSSETFRCLPTEVQHEILLQLKDTRKQNSWGRLHEMPEKPVDFSGFQMQRLLKRRHLQERLDEVVQEIGRKNHEDLNLNLDDGEFAESRNLASDETTRYVLIKKALSKSNQPKLVERKTVFPDPKEVDKKPIISDLEKMNKVKAPVLDVIGAGVQLLDDEFTQEELLFISGAGQPMKQEKSSSHEEDSDFEEVLPAGNAGLSFIPSIDQWIQREISTSPTSYTDLQEIPFMVNAKKILPGTDKPIKQERPSSTEEDSDLEEVSPPQNIKGSLTTATQREKPISSEDDSDLEEVPAPEKAKQILFSIPINQCQTYDEAEDIFSDVFRPSAQSLNTSLQSLQSPDASQTVPVTQVEISNSEHQVTVFQEKVVAEADDPITSKLPSTSVVDQDSPEASEVVEDEFITEESVELAVQSASKEESFKIPTHAIPSTSRGISVDPEVKVTKEKQPTGEPSQNKPFVIDERRREELNELNDHINAEQSVLMQQHARQERLATSITDQMYIEAQEMLRLFGIPYLVAPMEAEAQCAFLDDAGLTHGTITDDSDIWLFGGRQVYKNFFNQGKFVEFFEVGDIEKVFKLGRQKLIQLALLTGSDYTEGIESVGPVTAMEILAEFSSEGADGLERFRDWLAEIQSKNSAPKNKIRHKLRNLKIRPGFPSRQVVEAYTHPEVNESRRKFAWVDPDLDVLQEYLAEKIGWNREKFKSVVLPVLEKSKNKECQTRIDSFFSVKFPSKTMLNMSKRVMNAIHKADFGVDAETNSIETDSKTESESGKKRRRGAADGRPKAKTSKTKAEQTEHASTSGTQAAQVIWQKESDRQKLQSNKLKAIELFKNSRGRGKRPVKRVAQRQVQLSESDSN